MNIEQEYKNFNGLMMKFAKRYHNIYDIPFDDLKATADEAFVKACQAHTPDKGKLSNCIYTYIKQDIQNYCTWQYKKSIGTVGQEKETELKSEAVNQAEKLYRKQSIEQSSSEFQFVLKLLLEEHWGDELTICQVKKSLRSLLKKTGWTHKKIRNVLDEGKELVATWG